MTISNLSFFAENIAGVRQPGAVVTPVEPSEFSGQIYQSTQTPVISRLGHTQQVFVNQGGVVELTFRSSIKATLMGLYGFEDMTETRDADGRTITLTWTVPQDEPSVSWYFGARAKTAGGESEIFTIVHVGKNQNDVFESGKGTGLPAILDALNNPALTPGCTLIIKDGFYDSPNDVVRVGDGYSYRGYRGSLSFPNGVHTTSFTDNENVVDVSKFSCIMAESPLGVILDVQQKTGLPLHLGGNEGINENIPNPHVAGQDFNTENGNRNTRGVLIMGFALRGGTASNTSSKKCGFLACSIVNDHSFENPKPGAQNWSGDIPTDAMTTTEDSLSECNHLFGNNRYQISAFICHKATNRKNIMTMAACQSSAESLFNGVAYYNDYKHKNYNCWNLDSAEYVLGSVRYPNLLQSNFTDFSRKITIEDKRNGAPYESNHFVCYGMNTIVRALNDLVDMFGHCNLNTTHNALVHDNRSGLNVDLPNIIENSYNWHARSIQLNAFAGSDDMTPSLFGGNILYQGVTAGRNDLLYSNSSSTLAPMFATVERGIDIRPEIVNLAVYSPSWDYSANFTDNVFYGNGSSNYVQTMGGILIVDPPANTNTTWTSRASNYTELAPEDAISNGYQYVCRVDPKVNDPRPCQDIFVTKGRTLTWWNHRNSTNPSPDFETEYPDVNWYNRLSVSRIRREHHTYFCESNGYTLDGFKGHASGPTARADYYQATYGTTVQSPSACPYIINIWGYVANGVAVLTWDGIPIEHRGQANGYDFYIDDALVAEDQPINATEIRFTGLAAGSHEFYMIVKDPLRGNSGISKPINLVI